MEKEAIMQCRWVSLIFEEISIQSLDCVLRSPETNYEINGGRTEIGLGLAGVVEIKAIIQCCRIHTRGMI